MRTEHRLHHVATRIVPGSLETVTDALGLLDCRVVFHPPGARWAMIRQDGVDFNIQLKEVDEALVHNKFRADSHLAFISDNPKEQIDRVERWASEHNVSFTRGGWSDRELYFDLPELFVDFVVEVMHTSILED